MRIVADLHVHLYPCYSLVAAVQSLLGNLSRNDPGATPVAVMTERHDCHYFRDLSDTTPTWSELGLRCVTSPEEGCLILESDGRPALYLFAGRQIVTAERLEVLALLTDGAVEDGLPTEQVIAQVRESGGIPVLSWALGKWLFGRGRCVRKLIDTLPPDSYLLGDSSMRPIGWSTPLPMRAAQRKGVRIVAGSDALPFGADHRSLGTYGVAMDCDFVAERPVSSMRGALLDSGVPIQRVGRRCGPMAVMRRMRAMGKKQVSSA